MSKPSPTQRVEQVAFDAYHEISALPLLHTDAVCAILEKHFKPIATELEAAQKDYERMCDAACGQDAVLKDLRQQLADMTERFNRLDTQSTVRFNDMERALKEQLAAKTRECVRLERIDAAFSMSESEQARKYANSLEANDQLRAENVELKSIIDDYLKLAGSGYLGSKYFELKEMVQKRRTAIDAARKEQS